MSASREKKKRQEILASGAVDPKAAREAEKKASEKKSSILYACVAALFVVVTIGLLIYNAYDSGVLQRNKTAVTIDGEKYTVADAAYYYQNAYQVFLTQNGNLASMMGLDTTQPLDSQPFMGSTEQTWADYFKEEAVATMRFVHAGKTAAKAAGITLDENDYAQIEANKESITAEAAANGYTYKSYLGLMFGNLVTPAIYERNAEEYLLATKYASQYYESLSFTDAEIEAYRAENAINYDIVDAEYVVVNGTPVTKTDANGNTIEATEEETETAMKVAKEAAESILAAYKKGTGLKDAADAHERASYIANDEMSHTSTTIGEWMFDDARKAGDVELLSDDSSYYVAVFHGRKLNDAPEYNARHILVTEASLELATGETATPEMIKAKAEEILASWDGTESGFADLAIEYTQDTGSITSGGLYENVPKGYMVSQFEDWCYEEGRQSGDTGIVETSYGQHIMYFVGYGDTPYWKYACENALITDAYNTWQTELITGVTAEPNEDGMALVG